MDRATVSAGTGTSSCAGVRQCVVTITTVVEIEVSDGILALADYGTPEQIAAHLAWQMALHNREVDNIDGFADRSRDEVQLITVDTDSEATELKA